MTRTNSNSDNRVPFCEGCQPDKHGSYDDCPKERPTPCNCVACEAKAALRFTHDWRYQGAHHRRVKNGHNPREAKIVAAWAELADDRSLGQLLYDGPTGCAGEPTDAVAIPSVRDWFVATSVVQWLATNVGMSVLEKAGFSYQQWTQDGVVRDVTTREPFAPKKLRSAPGPLSDIELDAILWHLQGGSTNSIEADPELATGEFLVKPAMRDALARALSELKDRRNAAATYQESTTHG